MIHEISACTRTEGSLSPSPKRINVAQGNAQPVPSAAVALPKCCNVHRETKLWGLCWAAKSCPVLTWNEDRRWSIRSHGAPGILSSSLGCLNSIKQVICNIYCFGGTCGRVNLQGALEVLASLGGQKCKSRQELRSGRSPHLSERKENQGDVSSYAAEVGWMTGNICSISEVNLSSGEKNKFSLPQGDFCKNSGVLFFYQIAHLGCIHVCVYEPALPEICMTFRKIICSLLSIHTPHKATFCARDLKGRAGDVVPEG